MAAPPATFSRVVSTATENVTVDFTLQPIRSSNFQVLVQSAGAGFANHNARASRVYLGTVQGRPGALASGLLRTNNTLVCRISFETGVEWSTTGGTATVNGRTNWIPQWPTTGTVPNGGAGSSVYAVEVGVDSPFTQFRAANSSVDDTVDITEFSILAANVVFLRDAAILHRLGKLVVRTNQASDPYHGRDDTNFLLTEVRRQWEEVIPNVVGRTHHIALVAVPGVRGAGLAWVGTVGLGSNRYSSNGSESNGDFSVVWRHEGGHNWGSSHYEGGGQPEGPTIMSDNSLSRFSSSELLRILAHRNSILNLLQNLGPYPFPIPPRANMVTGRFIPGTGLTLDLLANDSDSNGQSLTLNSVPNQSGFGGQIQNINSGRIVYTTPSGIVVNGTDYFSYGIRDSASNTGTGFVTLRQGPAVPSDPLAGHWTFDDGSGNAAEETTSSRNHGKASDSGTSWTTGRIHGAIRLDGTQGYVVSSDGLNLNTNTVTLAAWVRRSGAQAQWAGIGMSRASGTKAGLNLGTANELRYHWEGNNPSFNFNSGLVLPDGQWTFCALVVSPTSAVIYMRPVGSSTTPQSATATGTFSPQGFADQLYIGADPNFSVRRFRGDIDDFRVYRRSLTAAEIISLSRDGGTPSVPSPIVRGTRIASTTFRCTWRPAPSSNSFEVYYGTNPNAVMNATTASPEFRGRTTSATFTPSSSLTTAGNWFWRVDASDGTTTLRGPVWYFSVVPNIAGVVGWWRMDDSIGTIVADSSGRDGSGTMSGGVSWGGGRFGGGLTFNGSGRVACGTAASLSGTTPFSVSAWVRVPTTHSSLGVIVQQRGPSGFNGQYQLSVSADGRPRFWVFGNSADQFILLANTAIRDDRWHLILAVRDGTAGRIFIDGVLSGSTTGTLRSLDSSLPVFIGFDGRDNNSFFTGSIEEVRIFNRVVSVNEIRSLGSSVEALGTSSGLGESTTEDEGIPFKCGVADDGSLPSTSVEGSIETLRANFASSEAGTEDEVIPFKCGVADDESLPPMGQ